MKEESPPGHDVDGVGGKLKEKWQKHTWFLKLLLGTGISHFRSCLLVRESHMEKLNKRVRRLWVMWEFAVNRDGQTPPSKGVKDLEYS